MKPRPLERDTVSSGSLEPMETGMLARWRLWMRLLHWGSIGVAALVGLWSRRSPWPPEYLEGIAMLFALLWMFLRYATWKTRGATTAREALTMLLHDENVVEPSQSRRLWYWECSLWLLLIPAFYFLTIDQPVLSLIAMVFLGAARFLIRRARVENGGQPTAAGVITAVIYVGMLLITLAATVLRATGH
jgi:hypothetical protein